MTTLPDSVNSLFEVIGKKLQFFAFLSEKMLIDFLATCKYHASMSPESVSFLKMIYIMKILQLFIV